MENKNFNNDVVSEAIINLSKAAEALVELLKINTAQVEPCCETKEEEVTTKEIEFSEFDVEIPLYAEDLELPEDIMLSIRSAADTIKEYIGIEDFIPKQGDAPPMIGCVNMAAFMALAEIVPALPRWKYKHIHTVDDLVFNSLFIGSRHDFGGLEAVARTMAALAAGIPVANIAQESGDLELPAGVPSPVDITFEGDRLLTRDELLKALGLDYTVMLLPGMYELFDTMTKTESGLISAAMAYCILIKAAECIWEDVPDAPADHLYPLAWAIELAASKKEAELSEIITEKFKDEIEAGVEFLTIPQIESLTGKNTSEVAKMLAKEGVDMRIVEAQRGGNLFIINKATLNLEE